MDDDGEIPLGGKRVRVFANVIQQAIDFLQMGNRDYVTLVAVGEGAVLNAISVYTGDRPSRFQLLTHETPPAPAQARERQPRAGAVAAKPPKGKKGRRKSSPRDDYSTEMMAMLAKAGARGISAIEIGNQLGLAPSDVRSRGAVTRTLAEWRFSGIIEAISEDRTPPYVLRRPIRPLEDADLSEETIMRILGEADQPLAIGVICDLAGIPRTERQTRLRLALIANGMHRAGTLDRQLASGNIAMYSLNEKA